MMKVILFITALLALVCSNKALQCYNCKTPNLVSSEMKFRDLPICDPDLKDHKLNISDLDFPVCKKIIEKIQKSGEEELLTIRTYAKNNEQLNLNKTIFTEYDCKTDLCNTGAYSSPAWLTLLLSIPVVISLNI